MDYIKDIPSYSGGPDKLDGELRDLYRKTHYTIKKVTRDIEDRFNFNTAISTVMELVNAMSGIKLKKDGPKENAVVKFAMESVVLLLAPMVPHFSEEIWEALGHESSILLASWPEYNKEALSKEELLIVVQVNGKLRSRFSVSADADDNAIKEIALSDDRVEKFIKDKPVKKVIVVKKKLVNIVV
jgi:leucyl-tRNA synthetase